MEMCATVRRTTPTTVGRSEGFLAAGSVAVDDDHLAQRDVALTALLNLHTEKRGLVLALDRRQRGGEPTDDLEVALAWNRIEAKALLESIQTNQ